MISRREFLQRSAFLTLAALAACSGAGASPDEPPVPITTPGPRATIAPPSPTRVALPPSTVLPGVTRTAPPTAAQAYLAVARGEDPARITRAVVDALGGMTRFVKAGDDVIIKPNICIASSPPEYAATTNPYVVGALAQMCFEVGAKRVRVMDFPFGGTAKQAYQISGIQAEVERAGGQMEVMNPIKYADFTFPSQARELKTWKVYQDILKADVLINVPIAKDHSSALVTLGLKNLMGVVQNRNGLHANLHQGIADLGTLIKPTLNLVDGVRVLQENGPTGGSLEYVKQANTLIASHDIVASDAYAAREFFGLTPDDVGYIRNAREMNLGRYDFEDMLIRQVQV